jgi:phosphonate transport system substrate-binding protein
MTKRRTFIKSAGALGTAGLITGCLGGGDGGDGDDGDGGDGTQTESGPSVTFGGDGRVDFAISPSVPQQNLYVQYGPVRRYLQNQLPEDFDTPTGLGVEMNLSNNYAAVIEALGQGTADVAETGPFAAALGVNSDRAEVILQRYGYGSWEYTSIIATPADSDIESLSDLSGKSVAFSDPLSTSGCLYPLYSMSSDGGLDIGNLPEGSGAQAEFEATFAGGHVSSYQLLAQGQVDAAGMGGFVRDTSTGPSPDEFSNNATTLHEDNGLPRAPIVVSPDLPQESKDAIQQAFLDAPDSVYYGADGEDGTDDDLWFGDVREADVDTYQSVIDVANELGVSESIFEE